MNDTFKIFLEFHPTLTASDRNGFLSRFLHGLGARSIVKRHTVKSEDGKPLEIEVEFNPLVPDYMKDALCRDLYRYARAEPGTLRGLGITKSSWWKPGAPDLLDDTGVP